VSISRDKAIVLWEHDKSCTTNQCFRYH